MMKWAVTVALGTIALATVSSAQAQTDPWPSKPVRIIVDSAPGSATDVAARLMADRLAQVWGGQQAIVDNRPGAGGSIAARAASQADPDGYTLYVGAASIFTAVKGATAIYIGCCVMKPIGVKSRGSSIGKFGGTPGAPLTAVNTDAAPT